MADYIAYMFQWIHVLFAIYLIGGGLFFEFFAKPSISTLPPQQAGPVIMNISKKFTIFVHIAWLVLIFTGLFRAFVIDGYDLLSFVTLPDLILKAKITVVVIAYAISIYMTKLGLDMGKADPQTFPVIAKRISTASRLLVVAGVFIVLFAVALSNLGLIE